MHLRTRLILALFGLVLTLVMPLTAWADGPRPPRSPFQSPPTPTPAPLPEIAPRPAPIARPLDVVPEPGGEPNYLFLPFLGMNASASIVAREALSPVVEAPTAETPLRIQEEDPRSASFVYVLKEGEALSDLAIEFGRDQMTMACAHSPDGRSAYQLKAGDEIVVPAMSDLCHRVKRGETVEKIASWYGISSEQLLAAPQNKRILKRGLKVGEYVLIPDARSRYRDPSEVNLPRAQGDDWRYGDGHFIWPIDRELLWVSQGFKHGKHMAVDLATWSGAKVRAADTGVVLKAGWSDNGYGYRIVIDHGIDYVTLYAHLSEYYVKPGDVVAKGDVIGAVGSTGNSTGPHLHFEVRDYGYLIDPLLVLPQN